MAKEIERRFLVEGTAWRDSVHAASSLEQFYLAGADDRSVRIRIADEATATLTLKFGGQALSRDEFEYPVPLAEAEEMRAFAVGNIIAKTRHRVDVAGYVYEVDVFRGALAGLIIAELETPDHVADAKLPDWLGREVTGEQEYYNAVLAARGLPERLQ
jgi:CYTH domain-containing protein